MPKNNRPAPKRHSKMPRSANVTNYRTARAAMLDRLADAELQHGHVQAAERLAHRAAEMRERGL